MLLPDTWFLSNSGACGYGEAFSSLLYNNYPGDDYQDIMTRVDQLIVARLH